MGALSRQVRKQMERQRRIVASCRRSGPDGRVQRLLQDCIVIAQLIPVSPRWALERRLHLLQEDAVGLEKAREYDRLTRRIEELATRISQLTPTPEP